LIPGVLGALLVLEHRRIPRLALSQIKDALGPSDQENCTRRLVLKSALAFSRKARLSHRNLRTDYQRQTVGRGA
jgi:hypothetical protein